MKINLGAMGDSGAQCPSIQQLTGVADITDPCQSSSLPPSVTSTDSAILNSISPSILASSGISTGSGISTTTLGLAVIAVVAVVFMGGKR